MSDQKPCPSCGHCPMCGHTPGKPIQYYWHYAPYTFPYVQPYGGVTNLCVATSGGASSDTSGLTCGNVLTGGLSS